MKKLTKRLKKFKNKSCCCICGFNYSEDALEFHHLNPKQKIENVSAMFDFSPDEVQNEIDKTVLLCRNCHRLLHYNEDFKETYTVSALKKYKGKQCSIEDILMNKWKEVL